jgi:hypothetical protein
MKLASMRRLLTNRYCGDWNVLSVTNSTAGSSKKAKTDGPKMQGKKKADNVGEAVVPQASGSGTKRKSRCVVGKDSYVRVLIIVFFRSTLVEENEGNSDAGGRASKKRAGAIIYPDISNTRSTGVDAVEMPYVNNERERLYSTSFTLIN